MAANCWQTLPISKLCLGIYDGPHATPKKTTSGPVFLGISNLADGRLDPSNTEHLAEEDYRLWTRRVRPESGDIVFSYETRIGQAAVIPEGLRCCLGRRMGLLRLPWIPRVVVPSRRRIPLGKERWLPYLPAAWER